mmetsp:Transcript_22054/g.50387  ORF Transcript_22054/g.50387 Transcript_22054/m.50387 type:complete len:236 (-) Transcript_22054:66-773(-)
MLADGDLRGRPFAECSGTGHQQCKVLCTGLTIEGLHYEYTFLLFAPPAFSWRVQRRYSALLAMHQDLLRAFTQEALPQFPPKSNLKAMLTNSHKAVAMGRIKPLQEYLQQVLSWEHLAQARLLVLETLDAPSVVLLQLEEEQAKGASLVRNCGAAGYLCDDGLVPVEIGSIVLAVWAGDGQWYHAVVRAVNSKRQVTVDWIRPAPLSQEERRCVCETGGDDTSHREVSMEQVQVL